MRTFLATFIFFISVFKIFRCDTVFKVEERIRCEKHQYWFYRTAHYERDLYDLTRDPLKISEIHNFDGPNTIFAMDEFTDNGDWTSNYEVETQIYHNCTSGNRQLHFTILWPDIPTKHPNFNLILDYDIDDFGDFVI